MTGARARRLGRWAAAILLAVLAVFGPARSSAASTTGGGTFDGVVTLPFFPCANCVNGTFTGSVALTLSGVGTSKIDGVAIPYTAVWPGSLASLPNASAAFSYDEQCFVGQPNNTPPLLGTAGGTFTVTGGILVMATGSRSGATLSGTFSWSRDLTAAHLTFSSLVITASPTSAINLSGSIEGQGGAGFVLSSPAGTCGSQVTNQTAKVAGVALQAV